MGMYQKKFKTSFSYINISILKSSAVYKDPIFYTKICTDTAIIKSKLNEIKM